MKNSTIVLEQRPLDFDPKVEVAAAYVEVDGKILLLQLSGNKENAKQWGVPAGKLEIGETPENALQRELFEETSISLSTNVQVLYLGKLYIRKPGIDYVYHAFQVVLKKELPIFLSEPV